MRFLELIPPRWLEWEPPSTCHDFGISEILGAVGAIGSLGGTLMSASAASRNADYQNQVAQAEATALNQKANADAAAGQRQAITQDRQTQLVQSRLAASSAASGGGGTTDPSDEKIAGNIAQQGSYNASSSLYEGTSRATSDQYQANIDLFKGQQAVAAAPLAESAAILSGISSFATNKAMMKLYTTTGTAPYSGL